MVRVTGFEPAQSKPLEPKSSASANSAIPAYNGHTNIKHAEMSISFIQNPAALTRTFKTGIMPFEEVIILTITYEYEGALYLNLTNRCDCRCVFCLRNNGNPGSIYADDLWLEREPTYDEALSDLLSRNLASYREIVFCGFGEPTYRIDDILKLSEKLKESVKNLPPIRINTNGHGNLISGRDITPELKGKIDALSISLNAPEALKYTAMTNPDCGEKAFGAMLDFTKSASKYVPDVYMTIVDKYMTPDEIEGSRALAESLGAKLRIRTYIEN